MPAYRKHILYLFLVLSVLVSHVVHAQTCNIIAPSRSCLGEPVSFQVQLTGNTAVSYQWDFNGEGSSTAASPSFIFNTPGSKNVSVIITLTGGGTCTASWLIKVNHLPQASFYIDSLVSQYCKGSNQVCLKDLSQRSLSGAPLKQRVVIWGDGAYDINSNPEGDRSDCHHYLDTGYYEVTIEVTDTNGCKVSYRQHVRIFPELKASFSYSITNFCDSARVCFYNQSTYDTLEPRPSFRWYWGNGQVDTTSFQTLCKTFYTSASLVPSLVLWNQHRCKDSVSASIAVNLLLQAITITKDKYEMCHSSRNIKLTAPFFPNADYTWSLSDSARLGGGMVIKTGVINNVQTTVPGTGKWYIWVTVKVGNCVKTSPVDSVIVKGPVGKVTILNAFQCSYKDTVYFCPEADYYRSGESRCKFLWNFGDGAAPNCLQDTKNGIYINNNCNYSVDKTPVKHKYPFLNDTCYTPKLVITDTVSGCVDEIPMTVSIGYPSAQGLTFAHNLLCYSEDIRDEFAIDFRAAITRPKCGATGVFINTDSAADPNKWVPFSSVKPFFYYDTVVDPDGWVTVGLIVKNGDGNVYKGCVVKDTTHGTTCYDTVWYHHFMRLLPEPLPFFIMDKNHGCNPFTVRVWLPDSNQRFIRKVYYDWGDGSNDTIGYNPSAAFIPSRWHTYTRQGKFFITLKLENENGCEKTYSRKITVGFFKDLLNDTVVCVNQEITWNDTIEYWDYETLHWRDSSRAAAGKERVWWDFGDGTTATGNYPKHAYKDTGHFVLKMIAVDSVGCRDTARYHITVVGLKAGIRAPLTTMVCSEIISFFDSSYKTGSYENDSIVRYWWDFGDKKTPSPLKDPTHAYSTYGAFTITHVAQNLKGCTDTARVTINMIGPQPVFRFLTDSIGCVPFSIELDNITDTSTVSDYLWSFGDPSNNTISTTSDSNVTFTYNQPGTYYLQLTGTKHVYSPTTGNIYYCKAVYPDPPTHPEKKVIVLPIPPADFTVKDTVCPREVFALTGQADTIYTDHVWHFSTGDSVVSSTTLAYHHLDSGGLYNIMYAPYYTPGPLQRKCYDTAYKKIFVTSLLADFDIDTILSSDPVFYFRNKSTNAVSYKWDFGHPGSGSKNHSVVVHPSHNYDPDTGTFIVCLIAKNSSGCLDTVCKPVPVTFFPFVIYYNVFTPANDDGKNDAFDIDIKGETEYDLRIYNRWGELVFEGNEDGEDNDGKNWNGRVRNTGPECPAGTYFYIFTYRLLQRDPRTVTGTCNLIREP